MNAIAEDPNNDLVSLIARLDAVLPHAKNGLPQDAFYLVSRLTPLVNVDLLVCDANDRVLLTWRDDKFYGPGWHIPGGIIRFKETAAERIALVAHTELGAEVATEVRPCRISEIMSTSRDIRGHFISLLYRCTLMSPLDLSLKASGQMLQNGMWRWFEQCPDNLIPVHDIYRDCFAAP
jgi:colanic acid biosynthesis protein WcaH